MGPCNSVKNKQNHSETKQTLRKVNTLKRGETYYGKRGDQSE